MVAKYMIDPWYVQKFSFENRPRIEFTILPAVPHFRLTDTTFAQFFFILVSVSHA